MIRNDIQPKLENIEEYFSKLEFYIPSYQRPYTWGVEQCEQLIEDINSHKDNFDKDTQDNYFFGAILISQDPEDNHEVTLIDGQQRTTTFMLLLKAILMKISKEISMLSEESREDKKLYSRLKNLKSEITSMLYNLNEDDKFDYEDGHYQLTDKSLKYFKGKCHCICKKTKHYRESQIVCSG